MCHILLLRGTSNRMQGRQDSRSKYIFIMKYFKHPENSIMNPHVQALPPRTTHLYICSGSPPGTADVRLGRSLGVSWELWVVEQHPCRHPLDARSPLVVTTTDVLRHCAVSHGSRPPWVRTTFRSLPSPGCLGGLCWVSSDPARKLLADP